MTSPPTAWIDIVSPAQPFFYDALLTRLEGLETKTTVRRKTETVDLARATGFEFDILGRDFDNVWLRKLGIPLRTAQLIAQAPAADVSLSSRNAMCILASKARGIPSIHFTDNDITARVDGLRVEKLYNRLESMATYNVVPSAFEVHELTRWHATPEQIRTYDGYKEDVYVAEFEPDPEFTATLPFEEYVVLRPEALKAAYVSADRSIVPDILGAGTEAGLNFVYLPRGRGDEEFAAPYDSGQVYVPDQALDGLQLAWHSEGVLTGSGTMAREAACMDVPAVSFFPNDLLSVDQEMVDNDMMFHSRDATAIVDFLETRSASDVEADLTRSKDVAESVATIVEDLIEAAQ